MTEVDTSYDVIVRGVNPACTQDLILALSELTIDLGLDSVDIVAKRRENPVDRQFNPDRVGFVVSEAGLTVPVIKKAHLRSFANEVRGSSQIGSWLNHFLVEFKWKSQLIDPFLVTARDGRQYLSAERAPALADELRQAEIRTHNIGNQAIDFFHDFCQHIYLPTEE